MVTRQTHAQLGTVAAAGGGCHGPDYVAAPKFATILGADVCGSHSIAVPLPAAGAVGAPKHASCWCAFATMSTHRTGTRGVALLLEHDAHSQTLRLIGELVANAAKRPLMEFLIGLGAFIQAVPDRAHIANDQLLDALPVQRVDQIAGLLTTAHQNAPSFLSSSVMYLYKAIDQIS